MNPNSSSIAEQCMSCFCCSANVTPRVTGVTSSPVHLCHMSLCHHCTCVHFRRALESQAKRCFDIRHHIGSHRFAHCALVGLKSSVTFQVTKVKKPLAAVSKITEKGNWVCFGPSEAYIENVAGKRTDLELYNGTYSSDVEYFKNQVLRGWKGVEEFDKTVQS